MGKSSDANGNALFDMSTGHLPAKLPITPYDLCRPPCSIGDKVGVYKQSSERRGLPGAGHAFHLLREYRLAPQPWHAHISKLGSRAASSGAA
jgi:hypothetical protein